MFGLIGKPLGHSYSVPIHAAFDNPSYRLIPLEEEALAGFLARPEVTGLNVTIPYKRAVIPFCSRLDANASAIGSVNTLVREKDGALAGYNTDAYGFAYLLKRAGISLASKKVLVFGGGGASLTVQAVARREDAREVVVVSRSGKVTYSDLPAHRDGEILVNATPLGMYPNPGTMAADPGLFPNCSGVVDLVYNPRRTALLLRAEALGIPCGDGLPMLVAQAKAAEELFFSSAISEEKMERVLGRISADKGNLILVGMPGSGKSTIGRLLANMSGRQAVDLDQEIEKEAGVSISDLFALAGEEAFRQMERRQAAAWGMESGLILMTGGGIVKDLKNYASLKQNGRIYWLERDPALLPREGRPLSQAGNLDAMYRERAPLYRHFMDVRIENNSTPENAAERIWREYCAHFGIERTEPEPAGRA